MRKYEIEIDDRAVLVVVKQYDSNGDEVSIANILPAEEPWNNGRLWLFVWGSKSEGDKVKHD